MLSFLVVSRSVVSDSFRTPLTVAWDLLVAQLVRNPPAMQETPVLFLGWEDPLEKGMATHSRYWILQYPVTGLENSIDRGAWQTTVHGIAESARTEQPSTAQTVAHQAPLSMGFSRQEYWNGLPFPSPGDLPDPRIKPMSPALEGGFLTAEPLGKPKLSSTIK